MLEITFRIPSKKVQYGFVEVKYTDDDSEMPSPEQLAKDYTEYVQRFVKAEATATPKKPDSQLVGDVFKTEQHDKLLASTGAGKVEIVDAFEVGDKTTVGGIEFTKVGENPFEDADDGNGHSISAEEVRELMRTQLGARVAGEVENNPTVAPWDGRGDVPKNLEPKPWQKGARKAPVADLFS